jgi:hypothetical protein
MNWVLEMLGYYTGPTFLKPSSFHTHLPAYEYGTECSETSAYKIQTPRKPNLFPYNTPTLLKTISFYTHLPAYEDGTELITFISPLMHSKIQNLDVKIYVV